MSSNLTASAKIQNARASGHFRLKGWLESPTTEIGLFGIRTLLVEPGFFRTDLLTAGSTTYAQQSIEDLAERTRKSVAGWNSTDGKQGGDPAKLAQALVQLAALEEPPARFAAAHHELSSSLAHDQA